MEINRDITEIKKRAVEKGVSLNQVCKMVGIRRDMLTRWEQKPPKYYEVIKKLNDTLDSIKEPV